MIAQPILQFWHLCCCLILTWYTGNSNAWCRVGEHATAMGQASERALSDGILSLYDRFPAIPSPPGGRPEVYLQLPVH